MRKEKSLFNILGSLSSYAVSTIFTFVTQTFIIKILGVQYSGVNGLFTNILTMLSIAELGIGTTIIFKLYKPLADDDKETIKSWMHFYKICYRIIAIIIMFIGLIILPIIPNIVGEVSISDNIRSLYFISLLDTVFSYTLTYKRSLIYVDQKNYVINVVHICYTVFMNITQIILLYFFKNYILFLLIKLIYRLLENIILNVYANIKYPYLKEEYVEISKEERRDVFDRIKAMFLQKVSYVVNKGIDSVVITIMLGIVSTGLYSNYTIIVTAITAIIFQIVSSMTASVGNLLTEGNIEKNYAVYKKLNMFDSLLTGLGICGFLAVINDFINLWVGSEYILGFDVTIAFAIYIYSDSIRRTMTLFKDSAGICKEDKNTYLVMAIINLVSSVILCKFIGMTGVIIGTAISYLYLIIYSYPKYIFKPLFRKDAMFYYKENFKYIIVIIISGVISYIVGRRLDLNNVILNVIIKGFLSVTIVFAFFYIFYKHTNEFKFYVEQLKKIKKNIMKKLIKKDI